MPTFIDGHDSYGFVELEMSGVFLAATPVDINGE